ncbi:TPA: 16S rRNA processing protein RimM [Candidatus Scatousia excrementigallinarum]|uniref:Ribosome maturation factor RimM n=1 Tax=Candidatus Scatousia excrementigallinarum TaxID=2840935 RepID=A0A9D1JNK1_9BACT|nr:16S rRNA processing protein RimM [Candidatus Scatousia excrementigallinarum]
MSKFISVGKILNFHGIQGEAKVGFSKGQQDFIMSLDKVFVRKGHGYLPLQIVRSRLNKTFALIKFAGIDSVNDILEYKGEVLFVEEDTIREKLKEDEFLIDELVGLSVFDTEDNKLGFVVGVSNNGANDLLSVKTNSKKICLVPFVKAIVISVSIKDKKIVINNLEGLLE